MTKIYKSAKAFRTALETKLMSIATKEAIDYQRLRKQVSYERLLARLFSKSPSPWLLKGGYAMQLRTDKARATQDVDLAMRNLKITSGNEDETNNAFRDLIQKQAAIPLPDYFEFIVTGPIKDLDAAPYGGCRFHIEARIDGRSFEKFHLDVGVGDVWIEPLDSLTSKPWLEFAGIPTQSFPSVSKEQQFAEKIHAYTLPHGEDRTNSRTKDLVDLVLLISIDEIDPKKLVNAIHETFKRRSTHPFDKVLPPPPTMWSEPYERLAKECDISTDLGSAYRTVQDYINQLPL
jgi:hypothetical protein